MGPTGQVSTAQAECGVSVGSGDFQVNGSKAAFIFSNLDGSISAWNGGTSSVIVVPASATNTPSYTGLAIGNGTIGGNTGPFIFAADQNSQNVDVYDHTWTKVGTLNDPNLPAGFTAFNVQNIGGKLFVTYANPNNPLGGFVDEFSTSGALLSRLITDAPGTHLQTAWGLAIAPSTYGQFAGDLLVGNNDGDGTINAYTLGGVWKGQLMLSNGTAFSQGELTELDAFGNGGGAGYHERPLLRRRTAGRPTHGLFGAAPPPPSPTRRSSA